MPSLLEQANQAALEEVRTQKPSRFTVGGQFVDGKLKGGVTFDRTWKNGWGATAYAYAWWNDAVVSTHTVKPTVQVGGEITKTF